MKPTVRRAAAKTPDGGELVLFQHDRDYIFRVNGQELMSSRRHESEVELARLGCAHLAQAKAPRVLVGGLGMGFTLRQVLNMLGPGADVVVSELIGEVVTWNHEWMGELNGHALDDSRVSLDVGDVLDLIRRSPRGFDAILLDVDNGPSALTDAGNHRLYGGDGLEACKRALRKRGCLAIWSIAPSKPFERLVMRHGFQARRYSSPAYKGGKARSRFIWVASEDGRVLPDGGGEPRRESR